MPETRFVTNALEHVYDSESHALITMDVVHERIHLKRRNNGVNHNG